MEKIVNDMKDIKESLFESFFDQNNNANNSAFNKLLVLKNLDEDLKETLVLLHSNYIAELETIKKFNYKALDQILSNNLEAYHLIAAKDNQLSQLFEDLEKKQPKLNTTRVITFVIVIASIAGFLGFMWYLFSVDKQAGQMIMDLVKMFLDKVETVDVNPIINPTGGE